MKIPTSIGKGKEEWHWTGEFWESESFARAHTIPASISSVGDRSYFFSQEPVLMGGVNNHPNFLTPDGMRGFLKFIEVNAELKPPTEQKGESNA